MPDQLNHQKPYQREQLQEYIKTLKTILISCTFCGEEIPEAVQACPYCNHPNYTNG